MALVYKITNIVNGNQYIGKTSKTLEERWDTHMDTLLYDSKSRTRYLYRALNFYGIDKFTLAVVEDNISEDGINEREKFWIKTLNTLIPNGYNMTEGGDGGSMKDNPNYIESIKRRDLKGSKNPMWGKRGENNPNFGSKRSKEQKENIQQSLQNAWNRNPNLKKQASQRIIGENNPRYGKIPPNALLLEIDGVLYPSEAEACRKLGLTKYFLYKTKIVIKVKKDD